jgi:hypothetical protein
LAVSPEPERRSRAAAPQGKQREQVKHDEFRVLSDLTGLVGQRRSSRK